MWTGSKPKLPSSKGISSHRKALEEEGVESGRDVHEKYRNEVIQMNRAMAELRSTEPKREAPAEGETWLERIGEKFGDFLAEPSALQFLLAVSGGSCSAPPDGPGDRTWLNSPCPGGDFYLL